MNNLVFNPAQITGNNWNIPTPVLSKNGEPIKVVGESGARSYQMMPNSRVVLFDATEPIFYIRETDSNNYPISFKVYKYEEVEETPLNNPQYVTMDEFNKFKEEILNGKYIWNNSSDITDAEPPTSSATNVGTKPESVANGNASKSSIKRTTI